MSKKLLVLGAAVMMICMVGCGEEETDTTTSYETQMIDECEALAEELNTGVYDLYDATFKEIYGEDFDISNLTFVDEYTVSYEGKTVSIEYVEEVAYNLMIN